MTVLIGPNDRFADLLKLSLSFRSVTSGVDMTDNFPTWQPLYQHYYEQPDYSGTEGLATGKLTHFHHPPLSTFIFLLCGLFIVRTGNPSLALLLFFCIYMLEVWSMLRIGIPRAKRKPELIFTVLFFCFASYPALITFGRGNYVNAGLTTIPIIAFLLAVFARKQASLASLLALAIAVNIHPNAVIFLLALPIAFGIRKAIKPCVQFIMISCAICGITYLAAHRLYPDYTLDNFRKGVAIYGKIYIADGAGIRFGSSLFGLIRALNRGLHVGISFPVEKGLFYIIAVLLLIAISVAYWRAFVTSRNTETGKPRYSQGGSIIDMSEWPLPLASFFLVSFYCILSPIFADYHLMVFLAPLILASLNKREVAGDRSQLLTTAVIASVLMLSPKNYLFQHVSVQILLNPAILCFALLWIANALRNEANQQARTTAAFHAADGR